jgi:branched-subunit amino acid transport protein
MSPRAGLLDGMRSVAPLLVGVVPFGLIFGVTAAGSAVGGGLGYASSVIIFAGAAQLATVQLITAGSAAAVVIATALVINARHLMYSAALAPHFREFPASWRLALPFILTDQAFAVSITRYETESDPDYRRWFFFGGAISLWVTWQVTTAAGVLLGASISRLAGPGIARSPECCGGAGWRPRGARRQRCLLQPRTPDWGAQRHRRRGHRRAGGNVSDWLVVVVIGVGTYALRLSFIGLLGTRPMPIWAQRPLRFVAPAVLSALVVPAVVLVEGSVDVTPLGNPRFVAAVAAALVAWRLNNVAGVIIVGMGLLWLLQALG